MTNKMKYVFFGTPEFAAIVLEKLISGGFPPAILICNPDKPVGRKKIIMPPKAKLIAEKHRIKVWQPEKLDSDFLSKIINLKPDFGIVAAYAKIIPKEIIASFPLGVIGVHPSLLPKHRGPSPIQSAILNGDKETGVALYLLDEKMDHGPLLAERELKFPISNFQFPKLLRELAWLSGDLLVETLPKFLAGEITQQPQNEAAATYTKKFTSADGFAEPADLASALAGNNEKSAAIERKIRALNPEPGVWTITSDPEPLRYGADKRQETSGKRQATKNKKLTPVSKRLKLLEAEMVGGVLKIKKTQLEGEKAKTANN